MYKIIIRDRKEGRGGMILRMKNLFRAMKRKSLRMMSMT